METTFNLSPETVKAFAELDAKIKEIIYRKPLTKKHLVDTARFQTFGNGSNKVNAIWYDWKSGDYVENGITKSFAGSKYLVAVRGTKKQATDLMFNWLTTGIAVSSTDAICWTAHRDQDRKKMPLSFNWNACQAVTLVVTAFLLHKLNGQKLN